MATPTGLSFPPRTRPRRSPPRARSARSCPGPPLQLAAAAMGSRACTSACTTRPTSPPAPRSASRSGAWADDEGRPRGDAQRGQVLAVQRAQPGGRRGRELPVHDDRAQRRRRAGQGRADGAGGGDRRAPRTSSGTRSSSTTSPGSSPARAKGEGLGNKFLANIRECDALLHVVRTHTDDERHPPRRPRRPGGGHRDDRDRAAARRPRHRRAPPPQGRPRRPLRRPRRGGRGGLAAPGDRGAAVRQARAHGAGARRTRRTRCATSRR